MRNLLATILLSLLSLVAVGQTVPTTQPTQIKYFFVYSQPVDSFDKWNALGFNGYFLSETKNKTVERQASRNKAKALGWKYFDAYIDDNDVNDPDLLGWVPDNSDEWNRRKPNLGPIMDQIAYLEALKARTLSDKLIMVNGDGMAITTAMWEKVPYNGVANGEKSIYTQTNAWSLDWYPVVNTSSNSPDQIARRPMYLPAQALWVLTQRWSPAWGRRPDLRCVILEANKGWKSPLGVTPAQMEEQAEYVLGIREFPVPNSRTAQPTPYKGQLTDMIVYWTANGQDGPGWNWDTSTPEIKAKMAEIIKKYKAPASSLPIPDSPELVAARQKIVDLSIQLKSSEDQKAKLLQAADDYYKAVQATTQPSAQ